MCVFPKKTTTSPVALPSTSTLQKKQTASWTVEPEETWMLEKNWTSSCSARAAAGARAAQRKRTGRMRRIMVSSTPQGYVKWGGKVPGGLGKDGGIWRVGPVWVRGFPPLLSKKNAKMGARGRGTMDSGSWP